MLYAENTFNNGRYYALKKMNLSIDTKRSRRALTIVELIIAIAMVTIIFAAILPQFAVIGHSWDSKQGSAEAIQNGRVFMDHVTRNLSQAVKVTAVSQASDTDGYIEFEGNDGNTLRYDIAVDNYVEFGVVGDLSDLAGPVGSLTFTCYDACDIDTAMSPVTDCNLIRVVKVDTSVTNSAAVAQDKIFSTCVYLRTNGNNTAGDSGQNTYDYAVRVQGTNIFAYDGQNNKLPTNETTPSTVLNSSEYDKIEADDGLFHIFDASANGQYALMRFVIQIDENQGDVGRIALTWNGKGINAKSGKTDGATLYIWNYSGSNYEQLQASADTEAELVLTAAISSAAANYIGGAGEDTITLLVGSNDRRTAGKANELYTDYVKVVISAQIYP